MSRAIVAQTAGNKESAASMFDVINAQVAARTRLPVCLARFREESAKRHVTWERLETRTRTRTPVHQWSPGAPSSKPHRMSRPPDLPSLRLRTLRSILSPRMPTEYEVKPADVAYPWTAVAHSFPTAHDGSLQLCDVTRPDPALRAREDVSNPACRWMSAKS